MPNEIFYSCELCGKKFQFGPGTYDGKSISRYNLLVCMTCWNNNHDGWHQKHENKIINKIVENNLPTPERNKKGLLPRDE